MGISTFGGKPPASSSGSSSGGLIIGQAVQAIGGTDLLPLDGRIVSKVDYPDLYASVNSTNASGLMSFTSSSKTITSGTWQIAFASTLNAFCAISGTNIFMSYDGGRSWVTPTTLPSNSTWINIVWTGTFFCAVSATSSIVSSTGSTWTSSILPKVISTNAVLSYDKTSLTLIDADTVANILMTSSDGITWSIPGIPLGIVNKILKLNNTYVAYGSAASGGNTNQVAISNDGITWAPQSLPSTEILRGGITNNKGFCLIGTTKTFTSVTGNDWVEHALGATLTGLTSITASANHIMLLATISTGSFVRKSTDGGSSWVALVDSGLLASTGQQFPLASNGNITIVPVPGTAMIATSTDHVNWVVRQLPTASDWSITLWNGSTFIIIPATGGTSLQSTDGIIWSISSTTIPVCSQLSGWRRVAYNTSRTLYVATPGVSAGQVITSTDGINWITSDLPSFNPIAGVVFGAGLFMVITSNFRSFTSTDGITWTQRIIPVIPTETGVVWNGSVFILLTNSSAWNYISIDGITWSVMSLPSSVTWTSMAYGNGVFVSAALSTFAVSTNGITWRLVTIPNTSVTYKTIIFAKGIFVALGGVTSTNSSLTSTDGITWTARTLPVASCWTSITCNGTTFVGVGTSASNTVSTIAISSSDGITWTQRVIPSAIWTTVGTNAGVFVAMSQSNTAATSPDGITWTVRSSIGNSPITSMVFAHGLYVGVANGASGLTSPDGMGSWTFRTQASNAAYNCIATNGTVTVSLAANTATAQSTINGTTWTARTLPISLNWSSVIWTGSLFVGIASGSNLSITSPDGITWSAVLGGGANASMAVWNGTNFLANNTSTNSMQTSTDGRVWIQRTPTVNTTTSISSASFINDGISTLFMHVINGAITIQKTTDITGGSTWVSSIIPVPYNTPIKLVSNGINILCLVGNSIATYTEDSNIFIHTMLPNSLGVSQTGYATPIWNGSAYIAVSSTTAGTDLSGYIRSNDGVTWSKTRTPENTLFDPMWINDRLVLTRLTGIQSTADNGVTWQTTSLPSVGTSAYTISNSGLVDKGLWFFNMTTPSTTIQFNPFYSIDGVSIVSAVPYQGSFLSTNMASNAGDIRVYVNLNGTVSTSIDGGVTYINRTFGAVKSIIYSSTLGLFIAVSTTLALAYTSTDGVTWTTIQLPAGTWGILGVVGKIIVAFGSSSTTGIYSTNGISWNTFTIPSGTWTSMVTDNINNFVCVNATTFYTISKMFDDTIYLQLPVVTGSPTWYVKAK